MKVNVKYWFCLSFLACLSCVNEGISYKDVQLKKKKVEQKFQEMHSSILNPLGKTIEKRFLVPKDYQRVTQDSLSYGFYLRNLPLKKNGEPVKLYDGSLKSTNEVHEAVINLPIGEKNLHQCADAVIRLRAEYLFSIKNDKDIHFNLTNGFLVPYPKWKNGWRVKVSGNKTFWVKTRNPSNTYKSFWEYLEFIFSYAGTHSLANELKAVNINEMQIGDVFIQGGFPGHAVLVVDMAIHLKTGEKIYMLAQSYMPAQELHVLKNRQQSELSPWYKLSSDDQIYTPEWEFSSIDLKRF